MLHKNLLFAVILSATVWPLRMFNVTHSFEVQRGPFISQQAFEVIDTGWHDGPDYAKLLTGRFIMKDAKCAGFHFTGRGKALWTNEIFCNNPDTLKIRWLDRRTFMTRTTIRDRKECPPNVDIWKVVSFDGKHLVLNSIWTGWGEAKDDRYEFTKKGQ